MGNIQSPTSAPSPVSEDEMQTSFLSDNASPQPLLAARYYLCAATHNNADAMLNLAHLLTREVVAREDVESLQFLPLPHGPLVNSLVQSVRAPSTSTSTDFSNAKKKHHHAKVSANDSASVRDIAMWLVDNAVTPSDSPVLAQEFSSLLDALKALRMIAIIVVIVKGVRLKGELKETTLTI